MVSEGELRTPLLHLGFSESDLAAGGNAARKLDQYAAQKVIHLRAVILRRVTATDLFLLSFVNKDLKALWERWETRSLSFPRLP